MINQKLMMFAPQGGADCGIIGDVIGSVEWLDNNTVQFVNTIHIAGTVYAFIHGIDNGQGSNGVRITTITINTDGSIGSVIDQENVSVAKSNTMTSSIKVSQSGGAGGDCVIAIFNSRDKSDEGGSLPTICRSWRISQAGTINGEVDSLEMGSDGATYVFSPNAIARKSSETNMFGVVFRDADYYTNLYTFTISDAGSFSAVLDSEQVDTGFNNTYWDQIIEVSSHFIVSYSHAADPSILKSYDVNGITGAITYLSSKSITERVGSQPLTMVDMTDMGFDGIVGGYRANAESKAKLVSYGINPTTGVFTDEVDSVYVTSGTGDYLHIGRLTGNGLVAWWQGAGPDFVSMVTTFTLSTSGEFSEIVDSAQIFTNLAYWDYPFPIVGSSNPAIYGFASGATDFDGYLQTVPISSNCI